MLLIDCGNSAIKCRLIQSDKVVDQVFPVHQYRDLTDFTNYLKTISIDKIYLASVSDEEITQKIKQTVLQNLHSVAISITSLAELGGLKNGYDDYKQLGVDRWLTLLAADELSAGDCFIIDAGTAIKIEILSKKRGYLGGAILPGFRTARQRFMRLFPHIDFDDPALQRIAEPGKSTLECLYIPDLPVSIESVMDIVKSWQLLLQQPYQLFLTGQDANQISQQIKVDHVVIPDLLFKGMLKQIHLQG